MRTLIIGAGEVGQSLKKVLETAHETYIRDKTHIDVKDVEVLNICYPYFPEFIVQTLEYIKLYNPKFTIIHSTVPVGTTRALGNTVVHSPIHGKHPDLSQSIRTFVKYVGGAKPSIICQASTFLNRAGISTQIVSSPEASELSKIMCTSYYGWNIVFVKEIEKICEENNINFFDVYSQWNTEYNNGYVELGMPQFQRPVLTPMIGGIGGHCVVNNAKLIKSFITDTIVAKNIEYSKKKK